MAAYSAGVLWPIPFALGWMQIHFAKVNFLLAFPLSLLFGKTVGFVFSFIPIYNLCRVLFKYLHPWLPYFKGVNQMLNAGDKGTPTALDGRPMIPNGPLDPRVQDDPKTSTF